MPSRNSKVVDVDLVDKKITIYGTSFLFYRDKRITINEDVEVPFYSSPLSNQILYYDFETEEFKCIRANDTENWLHKQTIVLMNLTFTDNSQRDRKSTRL